jgi:hypothetical protein
VKVVQALLQNGCFHPLVETWIALEDIKGTYAKFLAALDIKEEHHMDVNVLISNPNGKFGMRPQARSIQQIPTHKGWWFPRKGSICKALHSKQTWPSTIGWVGRWCRISGYEEDPNCHWMAKKDSSNAPTIVRSREGLPLCTNCLKSHARARLSPDERA